MRSIRPVLVVFVGTIGGLTGCNQRSAFEVKVNKIKDDGSQTLADVEKIMGGKGTEIPNATLSREDDAKTGKVFASIAEQYKGKRKLGKAGAQALVDHTVPDENGTEVTWIRWDQDGQWVYVAVLNDKVFNMLKKGFPKRE